MVYSFSCEVMDGTIRWLFHEHRMVKTDGHKIITTVATLPSSCNPFRNPSMDPVFFPLDRHNYHFSHQSWSRCVIISSSGVKRTAITSIYTVSYQSLCGWSQVLMANFSIILIHESVLPHICRKFAWHPLFPVCDFECRGMRPWFQGKLLLDDAAEAWGPLHARKGGDRCLNEFLTKKIGSTNEYIKNTSSDHQANRKQINLHANIVWYTLKKCKWSLTVNRRKGIVYPK